MEIVVFPFPVITTVFSNLVSRLVKYFQHGILKITLHMPADSPGELKNAAPAPPCGIGAPCRTCYHFHIKDP